MQKKTLSGLFYDILLSPVILLSAWAFLLVRKKGVHRLPISRTLLNWVGVFPIRHHYYDPLVQASDIRHSLSQDRDLPGIDWNLHEQLSLLADFNFNDELMEFPLKGHSKHSYSYDNGTFLAGDAEYFYSMLRHIKPTRLVEVGCGYTTRLAIAALARNRRDDPSYQCDHVCIEPFETRLPEDSNLRIVRELVENVPMNLFSDLQADDILFIDSSHMIRPQGDVLHEVLLILPNLNPGVWVHFHDVFSPRDYPEEWVLDRVRFWNEQYLLEAFLSYNPHFHITGAVNHLYHHHREDLLAKCPALKASIDPGEPSSFWIRKV